MEHDNKKIRYKKWIKIILGILVMIIFSLPYLIFKEEIKQFAAVGYLGLFVSCVLSNASLFIPTSSTAYVVFAATALNPWLCCICGGAGAALGEQVSYWLGVNGSATIKMQRLPEKYPRIDALLRNRNLIAVFICNAIPLPLYDLVGIAAGIYKMKWWKYTVAAVLGKMCKFTFFICCVLYIFPFFFERSPIVPLWLIEKYKSAFGI